MTTYPDDRRETEATVAGAPVLTTPGPAPLTPGRPAAARPRRSVSVTTGRRRRRRPTQ